MKKLLLIMIAAIVVVSCKDKKEDPQPQPSNPTPINYGTPGNCRYVVDEIFKDGIAQYYGPGTFEIPYVYVRYRDYSYKYRVTKDTCIYWTNDAGAKEEYMHYYKMNIGDCYTTYKK